MTLLNEQVNLAYTGIPTNCKSVKESKMMVSPNSALLFPVLTSLCSFFLDVAYSTVDTSKSETYIIKDCNSIQYRLMVDLGEPPFPDTACEIKQVISWVRCRSWPEKDIRPYRSQWNTSTASTSSSVLYILIVVKYLIVYLKKTKKNKKKIGLFLLDAVKIDVHLRNICYVLFSMAYSEE